MHHSPALLPAEIFHRNNVRLIGQGSRTLVMAHGFGCDQEIWRFLVPELQKKFRLVLFDYTGFGKSDFEAYRDGDFRKLEDYATTLLEVIDCLEVDSVDVVGHSVSGMIAALAQVRSPDRFGKLSMICPSPCYLNHPPDYEGGFEERDIHGLLSLLETNDFQWASVLAGVVSLETEHPAVREELEERFCAALPQAAHTWARLTFMSDYRQEITQITVPTQVFQCQNDAVAPVSVGNYLHQHIPHSKLVLLSASGHCPHLTHPGLILPHLLEFLG